MRGKRIKQINNLIITYTIDFAYTVYAPDGRCLEDRLTYEQAIDFCKHTTDFIKKK